MEENNIENLIEAEIEKLPKKVKDKICHRFIYESKSKDLWDITSLLQPPVISFYVDNITKSNSDIEKLVKQAVLRSIESMNKWAEIRSQIGGAQGN